MNEQQIKKANEIMKKGLGVLVNKHLANKEFTELDQRLLDELNDLSLSYNIEKLDLDTLCGLQYLYDKDFKGDEDFYPTTNTIRNLLNI